METKDPYKVLGLSGEASQEDIRKAHRRLVRKYHPDTNLEDPRAEERFKEVQQAYEILSNHEKRQEYEKSSRTSPRGNSGGPRAGAGRRTGGGTTHTVALSELLGKLANLSRDGAGGRKDGGFQLRGEEEAHLGKLLGEKISRISALLGADPARLSKLLDENIKMNVKANFRDSFRDAQSGGFSTTNEDISVRETSGADNKLGEKRVKGPGMKGRDKRVKGSSARRQGRRSS
jgi:curved DNA-binding protein CbpA